jgi:hypothetical protein
MTNDYRQCKLVNGDTNQTCWIPSKFAQIGRILKLKTNGQWIGGWLVKDIYPYTIDKPIYSEKMIRSHTKRTGDSLPKEK